MWTCQHCDGATEDDYAVCWTCRIPRGGPADYHENPNVLLTSTQTLRTHVIAEYVKPVFGETVYGANVLRDAMSGFTDVFGGRSGSYEKILSRGRIAAIHQLQSQAETLSCNAVIGLSVQYEPIGSSMFMICASGTAVRAIPIADRLNNADNNP